jgi:predicted solute-binding protein
VKIGIVDYINTLPLVAGLQPKFKQSHEFIFNVPSVLNGMLNRGEIDLGLVSCAEFLDSSSYDLFSNFGIVAHGAILSVNLYIKSHIRALHNARVALTDHSATSISLLKVLCHHYWKVTPLFEPLNRANSFDQYEGFLLIGDEALGQQSIAGFTRIDLAQAWYYATGLPFVFAVFAVRKEVEKHHASELKEFHEKLQESYAWAQSNPQNLLSLAEKKCGLSSSIIKDYYQCCHHQIRAQELEALYKFAALRNCLPFSTTLSK